MIAEDERLAREELVYLLQQADDVVICPSAETGDQLLELYRAYKPNVIFLDIQMPGLSGVEVAKQLTREAADQAPLFVFTTAYDDYAVEAFEVEAVDYLLKPYDDVRFRKAMERVRRRLSQLATGSKEVGDEGGSSLLSSLRTSKLLIDDGERIVVLSPDSICYAARVERMVEIHTEKGVVTTRMTLQELEKKLHGYPFFRTHRSYLVNLDYIQEMTPWFNGAYNLVLKDEKRSKIPVSRAARKYLFQMFEPL